MLATAGPLPDPSQDDRWGYEMKWDGMRVVAESRPDGWALMGRSGRDVTASFPDLAGDGGVEGLAERVGGRRVVVDGEVVVVGPDGRPSFSRLQQRMNVARPTPDLVAAVPVQYLVFDLLALGDVDATEVPYRERRRLLDDLDLDGGPGARVRVPSVLPGGAEDAWAAAEAMRMEGIVAKRLDSPYVVGRRSPAWRKVKLLHTQEVVIVGWAEGEGRRSGGIGALLVAVPADDAGAASPWRSAGRVGTGFTDQMLDDLAERLAARARPDAPVEDPPRGAAARGVHWVEPEIVGEVAFSEWTPQGTMRQPSWRGLRPDKGPEDVVIEPD